VCGRLLNKSYKRSGTIQLALKVSGESAPLLHLTQTYNFTTRKDMKSLRAAIAVTFLSCFPTSLDGFHLPIQVTQIPGRVTRHRSVYDKTLGDPPQVYCTRLCSSNDDGVSPRNPGRKIIAALQRITTRLVSLPMKASSRFSKLPRRAKSIIAMQALIVTLLCGSVGRKMYAKHHAQGVGTKSPIELPYSSFLDLIEDSDPKGKSSVIVDNVGISPEAIMYRVTKPETAEHEEKQLVAYSRKVAASPELLDHLRTNKIPFTAARQRRANSLGVAVRTVVLGFYMLILFRMYKSFSGNSGAGDTPGKLASTSSTLPLASFNDIQGIDEAKMEVMELVDTLRNPEKYAILGARAPKGLLLEGPPGTGKTMLARATAATAGVPLLYCSGSDFVEMFVGRGAARVRKLFEKAARLAPCIIFVDELDALGKSRDSGSAFMNGRGNDEAEQTLNQLLTCMDGLDSSKRICVLAATNRKEVLDTALIRPGRFDRIVKLELPNANGRENILRVHSRKLPGFQEAKGIDEKRLNSLGRGNAVDLSAVAAVTAGLSGAELEYLVNEAAIRAVRRVSAALKEGNARINPNVRADDFEASVQNYFATRKPKSGVNEVWKNVWGQQ
jgi:ATP-dependent Zn protease